MASASQRGARLISAAGRGDLKAVRDFIENDSSLLRTQDDETGLFPGWTALHWTARNGHVEVAKLLLDEADRVSTGDDPLVSLVDQEGDQAMHIAVSWGQMEMIELLCNRGGGLLSKNQAGKTPLDLASSEIRGRLMQLAGISSNAAGQASLASAERSAVRQKRSQE